MRAQLGSGPDARHAGPGDVRGGRVRDAMSGTPITVESVTPVGPALARAERRGVDHLLVSAGRDLAGVVCTCELWGRPSSLPIAAVVAGPPPVISPDSTLEEAAAVMEGQGCGLLVVVEPAVVGVITRGDLIRAGLGEARFRRCVTCGGYHHLHGGPEGAPFCRACLAVVARADFDELYIDLGGGD